MPPLPPITQALMIACSVVYFIQFALGQGGFGGPGIIDAYFGLWPLKSEMFWLWQPISYAFLHGSMSHLFFNMLGLWMFGADVERVWGRDRYIRLLVVSTLSAAAAQLLIGYFSTSMGYTIGASGALFGLLLSYAVLFPDRVIMPLIPPIPMKAKTFVLVFGALELVLGSVGNDGIAHFAHLGGALGAFLLIRSWYGPSIWRRLRR
jgi:membrane associated rhomboid family serine protease